MGKGVSSSIAACISLRPSGSGLVGGVAGGCGVGCRACGQRDRCTPFMAATNNSSSVAFRGVCVVADVEGSGRCCLGAATVSSDFSFSPACWTRFERRPKGPLTLVLLFAGMVSLPIFQANKMHQKRGLQQTPSQIKYGMDPRAHSIPDHRGSIASGWSGRIFRYILGVPAFNPV